MLRQTDEQLCSESQWDFSDLRAMYINCTLKRSPEISNTQGLADHSIAIMRSSGCRSRSFGLSTMRSRRGCGRT